MDSFLVDALLRRGSHIDLQEAQAAIDRLAAVPTEPGFELHELPLLRMRALLARAHGDEVAYRGVSGTVSREGDGVRLRGSFRLGRGDAMTALGEAHRRVSK